jgi:hypothetical protein
MYSTVVAFMLQKLLLEQLAAPPEAVNRCSVCSFKRRRASRGYYFTGLSW